MKVFWSWQSDHLGRISRHFVRGALQSAIEEINESPEIQEAERPVTLDHDRKGVPGSPDLARIILEKIRASDVVVADVTTVGKTASKPPKKLTNSNVAIELGYALANPGDLRLLMVMNEHYGSRSDLPFDLAYKAGPPMYRLAPDATNEDIKKASKELAGELKKALREMLPIASAPEVVFEARPSITSDPSRYFPPAAPLVTRSSSPGGRDRLALNVPMTPLVYARVMPSRAMPELKLADAVELIRKGPLHLESFYYQRQSLSFGPNEYGAIAFEFNPDEREILCAAQLFVSREIWAFNATLLHPESRLERIIPMLSVEQTFAIRLREYIEFARTKLGVAPPIGLEGGAAGISGYMLGAGRSTVLGPIQRDRVAWRGQLRSYDPAEIDIALLGIFESFFDAAAQRRPRNLHKFPGAVAGAVPA